MDLLALPVASYSSFEVQPLHHSAVLLIQACYCLVAHFCCLLEGVHESFHSSSHRYHDWIARSYSSQHVVESACELADKLVCLVSKQVHALCKLA